MFRCAHLVLPTTNRLGTARKVQRCLHACLGLGLGFRAQGFGFRVSGLGFRVEGLGFEF